MGIKAPQNILIVSEELEGLLDETSLGEAVGELRVSLLFSDEQRFQSSYPLFAYHSSPQKISVLVESEIISFLIKQGIKSMLQIRIEYLGESLICIENHKEFSVEKMPDINKYKLSIF